MSDSKADLLEIFSSIQGEGLFVGVRQVFIRFQGCNLECLYCDTGKNALSEWCTIEQTPGRRDFVRMENPIGIDRITGLLGRWAKDCPGLHHSISLTGGEPLLNQEILREWLPALRAILPIHLETNGTLYAPLAQLIGSIDHISMDIKLPSSSGQADLWEKHRKFLETAAQKSVAVKIVIGETAKDGEIITASELISSVDRNIPLILQPVSLENGSIGIPPLRALELYELAAGRLREVRIIPQTHKYLGNL
jgi:7-carboxy-7-deazaguanine synthase